MSKTMTISQALAELTLYDKKINKKIGLLKPIVAVKENEVPQGYESREAFVSKATSDFQSVKDLIGKRASIKAAIIKSNQNTNVTMEINGSTDTYTVAEAIIIRETQVTFYDYLQESLRSVAVTVLRECAVSAKRAEDTANEAIKVMLSGSIDSDSTSEAVKQLQEQYRVSTVKSPLGVVGFIDLVDSMPEKHDELLKTIDHTLSVSNATTQITV